MSEQQSQTTATAVQATTSACPHPEAVGQRWGDPIAERQAELQSCLDRWAAESDHGKRKGPFQLSEGRVALTGADVFWLAERVRDATGGVPELHLEGAYLIQAHLEGADLFEVRLDSAMLLGVHLEHASLGIAHLTHAQLEAAHLEGTYLDGAHLEKAVLARAHLENAILSDTHLEDSRLREAHLEGANLREARLEGADLISAHLEGAELALTHLEGAYLRGAWLDSKTVLSHATLDCQTMLGDIHWSGVGSVDLTQIDWARVPRLGDEAGVGCRSNLDSHLAVVRSYRQVAAQLRAQGIIDPADGFLLRAHQRERVVRWRQRKLFSWFFSWVRFLLAGYGYRPGWTAGWYVAIVATFAALYTRFGMVDRHHFNFIEAAVFSVTSFHGRGFFPGGLALDDPVTVLAAVEAVVGLFIEITFIATFTQRYFGAR